MSAPLIGGCLWVLVATVTAMLPMRRQMIPGIALLLSMPVLVVWIGLTHGWFWLIIALFAVGSMLRNPLIYLWRRLRGLDPQLPPELR